MAEIIQQQVDLQSLNTLAIPARAEYYCQIRDHSELAEAIAYARHKCLSTTVLGEGSNVVLGNTVPGLLLHQLSLGREVLAEDAEQVTLAVAGGENWHSFVDWSLQQGYCGLENLALIPGSVGAAPIQNLGAYGVEVERFIVEVHCRALSTAKQVILSRAQCKFGYRDSIFKRELQDQMLVQQVIFCLPKSPAPVLGYPSLAAYLQKHGVAAATPRQVFEAVSAIRNCKLPDPRRVPNAGSFFKNPVVDRDQLDAMLAQYPDMPHFSYLNHCYKLSAAWLIQACGFRECEHSVVRLHPEHALVIINPQHQDAPAIRKLAAAVADAVLEHFDICLEQEPRNYG